MLRPLVRLLAGAGVTANQVTVLAAVLSVAAGVWIGLGGGRIALLAVPAVLLVRMALNAMDGMLAREHGMASPLGAILNELGDVVSDAALYLPLAAVEGVPAPPLVAVVLLAVITEMAGVVAVQIGASRRYDGPMGKSDRAFVFGLGCLLLGLGVEPGPWVAWTLWAVAGLLALTVVRRCRRALAEAAP